MFLIFCLSWLLVFVLVDLDQEARSLACQIRVPGTNACCNTTLPSPPHFFTPICGARSHGGEGNPWDAAGHEYMYMHAEKCLFCFAGPSPCYSRNTISAEPGVWTECPSKKNALYVASRPSFPASPCNAQTQRSSLDWVSCLLHTDT